MILFLIPLISTDIFQLSGIEVPFFNELSCNFDVINVPQVVLRHQRQAVDQIFARAHFSPKEYLLV